MRHTFKNDESVKVWRYMGPEGSSTRQYSSPFEPFLTHIHYSFKQKQKSEEEGKGRYLKKLAHPFTVHTKRHWGHITSSHIIKLGAEWGEYPNSNDDSARNEAPKHYMSLRGNETWLLTWHLIKKGRDTSLGKNWFKHKLVIHPPRSKSRVRTFRKLGSRWYYLRYRVRGIIPY